jgi:hypothetical protein
MGAAARTWTGRTVACVVARCRLNRAPCQIALRGRAAHGTTQTFEGCAAGAIAVGIRHAVDWWRMRQKQHSRSLGSGIGAHGWIHTPIASQAGAAACAIVRAARGHSLAWTVTHIGIAGGGIAALDGRVLRLICINISSDTLPPPPPAGGPNSQRE